RAFVPIQAEPFQPLINGCHRFFGVSLGIGVFNSQDEFPAVVPREEPVEKGGSRPANVQIASRRGRKTDADIGEHYREITQVFTNVVAAAVSADQRGAWHKCLYSR